MILLNTVSGTGRKGKICVIIPLINLPPVSGGRFIVSKLNIMV
jgi:hypothetical protein